MCTFEDSWDYFFDYKSLEKTLYDFESKVLNINEINVKQLEDCFKIQKNVYPGLFASNHEEELRVLIEKNKDLRQQIDTNLEALSHQQTQYETYKKDQKLLAQEIKETHEAFLTAKKYYKKFLKMYHTIESKNGEKQTIYIQFFTEAKKDSENYSVRLLRNIKTGQYQLISTTPKLTNMKELQKKLQESNDVPGALCTIRQAFISMKHNKKH